MNENWLTSKKERGSYGLWFVGQNIIFMLVLNYLTIYLTDEVGLLPAAVAVLLVVARVWDAVNDPMLGALVDRAQPKKGKFKPWINAVTLIMPIVTIFVFFKISGNGTINLTYAYITYIIWGMTYTISDVPIFALATTMTDNNDERVSIMSIGRLAAGIASLIAGIIAAPAIDNLGYTNAVIILMVISLLTMLPLRFFVRERVMYKREGGATLKEMFSAVANNKYLLIFYISFILIMSTFTGMSIGPFFAKWNLGDLSLNAVLMMTMFPSMVLIPIFAPKLIRRFGKRKIFIVGMIISIVFSIIQYFAGYENFGLFLVLNFIKSIGLIAPMIMMGMFTADCVEYGDWKTGVRKEGVTFSVQTFSTKLGTAFSGALTIAFIGWFGYDGSIDHEVANQSTEALEGIWMATTIVPVIGLVLGLIVFTLFYKLGEDDVARMMAEKSQQRTILTDDEAV